MLSNCIQKNNTQDGVKNISDTNRQEPLVTIIIPAYNASDYISKCVDSVLRQNYRNTEIIIIDDGSTDETYRIIQEYRGIDSRINCFHYENHGVSSARNIGLQHAKGKYIVFVDADDTLPYDSIYNRVQGIGNSDILIANYRLIIQDKEQEVPEYKTEGLISREKLLSILLEASDIGYQGYLWNKLFINSIIQKYDIRFDESIVYNEDRLFCVEYGRKCQNGNISNDRVYLYQTNNDSAMSRYKNYTDQDQKKVLSEYVAYDRLIEITKEEGNYLTFNTAYDALISINRVLQILPQNCKLTRGKLHGLVKKYCKIVLFSKNAPNIKRIKAIFRVLKSYF